jgi:hypothetical protein
MNQRLPRDPTAIKEVWSRFKPVSHLWAAVQCKRSNEHGTTRPGSDFNRALFAILDSRAPNAASLRWHRARRCVWRGRNRRGSDRTAILMIQDVAERLGRVLAGLGRYPYR